MQPRAWLGLLRRLPPEQHDNLSIVTSVGTEISIQNILRMEDDYLVLRGRMAGTTDTGRIFFVPYDQINYLGSLKELPEVDVLSWFGAGGVPAPAAAAAESVPEASSGSANGTQPAALPAENEKPPGPARPQSGRISIPNKQAILDRLRARSQVGTSKPPNP
jgi:hypothetical protein